MYSQERTKKNHNCGLRRWFTDLPFTFFALAGMLITKAQHSGCHVHLKIMPIPHIPLLQNSSLGDQGSWIYYRLIFFLGSLLLAM